MPRKCSNHPDKFCYICGVVILEHQKRRITPVIRKAYSQYFGLEVCDQNQEKGWAPRFSCSTCCSRLRGCQTGRISRMPFSMPMLWSEPTDHSTDCYFCMIPSIVGVTLKKKRWLSYPNVPSAIRPTRHEERNQRPAPRLLANEQHFLELGDRASSSENRSCSPDDFSSVARHKISQSELLDLISDIALTKAKMKMLESLPS